MRTLKLRNLVGVMASNYITMWFQDIVFIPFKGNLNFSLLTQLSVILRTCCCLLLLLADVYCSWAELCPNASSNLGLDPPGLGHHPPHNLFSDPGWTLCLTPSSKPIIPFLENSSTCFPCLVWTSDPNWMMLLRAGTHSCLHVPSVRHGAWYRVSIQLKLNKNTLEMRLYNFTKQTSP